MAKKPPEGEKVRYTNRRFRVLRKVVNHSHSRDKPLIPVSYWLQVKLADQTWATLEYYDYFRNARNRAKAASEAIDTFPFRSKRLPDKQDLKMAPNRPGCRLL